jgi:molybdopterin synthase catalytic subunit
MIVEQHPEDGRFEVRIADTPIDAGAAADIADDGSGAVAVFRGVVRADNRGREVEAIEYECYRAMAEREVLAVLYDAAARYELRGARVVHRTGIVRAGESSVLVAVAAAHRAPAFDALRDIVEALKRRAPIWKKEHYAGGDARWL